MKAMKLRNLAIIGFALLAGCAHQQPQPDPTQNPMAQVSDAAANEIAEAAAQVSHSLTNLEAVEKADMTPQAAKLYPQVAQVTLPGTSSIDWNGPIEPLLKQIAAASGYKLKIYGDKPITPIIVTLHAQDESNADIVRDAALQADNHATIKTVPASKVIELRYLGR